MTTFIDWYSDPENAEERREIIAVLRCTETEAVTIQMLGDLSLAIDTLGMELGAREVENLPDEEGDEPA